jgi:hypothetical protein
VSKHPRRWSVIVCLFVCLLNVLRFGNERDTSPRLRMCWSWSPSLHHTSAYRRAGVHVVVRNRHREKRRIGVSFVERHVRCRGVKVRPLSTR